MTDSTENVIKFRKALREVFSGKNGEDVLNFLQQCYVDVPALDSTPELTYYRLGQKEFVQGLIKDATSEEPSIQSINVEDV